MLSGQFDPTEKLCFSGSFRGSGNLLLALPSLFPEPPIPLVSQSWKIKHLRRRNRPWESPNSQFGMCYVVCASVLNSVSLSFFWLCSMLATTLVVGYHVVLVIFSFSTSSSPSPSPSFPLSFPLEGGYSCGCIIGLNLCTSWLEIKYSLSFLSYLGYQLVWVFVSPSSQLIYWNLIPNMTVVICEAFSGWLCHGVGPPSMHSCSYKRGFSMKWGHHEPMQFMRSCGVSPGTKCTTTLVLGSGLHTCER